MNNPLKYSNCWEDADLLANAMQVDGNSHILSIASAGDNSLYLLKDNPASLTCVDLNEIQLFTSELKATAIQYLDYSTFLGFLGFTNATDRWVIFKQIESHLSMACSDYLNSNRQLITLGIIHQGKFEKYFQIFSNIVLPFIHNKKEISELFREKSAQEQKEYYDNIWNNRRWKFLFKLFFSKWVMGKFGREPEKLQHVEEKVSEFIYHKAAAHLSDRACQHNYILHYALTGNFGDELPPFAKEEHFNTIKQWLQNKQIVYKLNTLEDCLLDNTAPHYNRFNLSNIFEYMPVPMFHKNLEAIYQNSEKGSRLAYWNLMVVRQLTQSAQFEAIPNTAIDKGFFYRAFISLHRL
jgi:S-adenosylmethionine-diacylglycerol 3-amino-3-carboxypropyl transferase